MARAPNDERPSIFAQHIDDRKKGRQSKTEQKPEPEASVDDDPELTKPKDEAESDKLTGFPRNKCIAYNVDAKILRSPGALVLFPCLKGTKWVTPVWESTASTSIQQCIMKIAPNPAVVAAQKYYQVPYAIGGVLKEVELINAQLRERRIKAGQFDDRQAAFASTHCIARTIIYS